MELSFLKECDRDKTAKVFAMHTLSRRFLVELALAIDPNNTRVEGQFSVRLNESGEAEFVIDTRVTSLDGTTAGSIVIGKSDEVDGPATRVEETQMVNLQMARRHAKRPPVIHDMEMLDKHYNMKATLRARKQRIEQIKLVANLITDPFDYDPLNCYRLFEDEHGVHQITEYSSRGDGLQDIEQLRFGKEKTLCWFRMLPTPPSQRDEKTHHIAIVEHPSSLKVNPVILAYMPVKA